ncbi:RadC family protein [Piscinibacter sakaiensis]|uniref:RadC family protein n=1 Tax=Piscinibacter sakaiensis TaxID=1547922 RepID=UPI003AADE3FF
MNPNQMTRAELVGELLATAHRACEQMIDDNNLNAPDRSDVQTAVDRKLNVARELLMRDLKESLRAGPLMSSPQSIRDWLRLLFSGLDHEVFVVLYLDAQHRLIDAVQMFRGTLTQTSVYPREIVKGALLANAAAAAFAHNHPSGDATPSRADEHLTQTLKAALSLVDVRVLDHFVVARTTIVSFAERGLL